MPADDERRPHWLRLAGLGVELAGAVAGFTLLGYGADRLWGTEPWGVVIGATLGLLGGMYNAIRVSLAASREAGERDKSKTGGAGR